MQHMTASVRGPQHVVARIAKRFSDAKIFAGGHSRHCCVGAFGPKRSRIFFFGDCEIPQYQQMMAQAKAAGISDVGPKLLFDFTHFSGTIDWAFVRQRQLTPSYPELKQAAFLMHSVEALMIAKGIASYLDRIECKAFLHEGEAYVWLGWLAPHPTMTNL